MSDDFKKKWEAYEKGELTGEELEAFEKELAQLEEYQSMLENMSEEKAEAAPDRKLQRKVIKKGKWKARLQTAFTALGIFLLFAFISSLFTNAYYSWGTPGKSEEFKEVIDHTLTITDPYGYLGGTSTNTKPFFGMEATRDLEKRVGSDTIKVGEMEINFLFSMMAIPEISSMGKESQNQPAFYYPGTSEINRMDWDQLEKLPEGTVVSAYVSFAELMESKEVEAYFLEKEMDLLWLGVDTGLGANDSHGLIFEPIGFPSYPIWHADDMTIDSQQKGGNWFFGWESESSSSPTYNHGDQEILHEQFMKTLYFLQDNEKKAKLLSNGFLNLEERLNYLENNDILHYGAVITGPTKEILELQDEPLIAALEVDEVAFWNWD
jgi:hypothetical protein